MDLVFEWEPKAAYWADIYAEREKNNEILVRTQNGKLKEEKKMFCSSSRSGILHSVFSITNNNRSAKRLMAKN